MPDEPTLTATTDAVNVGQLSSAVENGKTRYYSVNDGGNQGGNYVNDGAIGSNALASGVGTSASGNEASALGSGSSASGNGATAVGASASASGVGAVAVGQNAAASADGSVALGANASDGGRGAESYTGKYSNALNASVGTVSVGNATTGETRTISNLADGKVATDAVNLRQLDGALAAANTYTDTQIGTMNGAVTHLTNQVTQNTADITSLQNGTDGFFQVNNTDGKGKPSATGNNASAGGAGAVASGSASLALGTAAKATADHAVALGSGSVADRAYSVSVGSIGRERQITNVAAGTAGTDAVNVNQLQVSQAGSARYDTHADGTTNYNQLTLGNGQAANGTTISNVAPGVAGTDAVNVNQLNQGLATASQYADQRYNQLRGQLATVRKDADAGTAGALATANLPQVSVPGKSMAAAGVGNYQGQTALALGVSKMSDSGQWIFKASATANTRGKGGVGAGVGFQW